MRRPRSIPGLLFVVARLHPRTALSLVALVVGALGWCLSPAVAPLRGRPRLPPQPSDSVAIAPAPDGWLVVWSRKRPAQPNELVVARLDPRRWRVDEARVVATAEAGMRFGRVQARWGGDRFGLVWTQGVKGSATLEQRAFVAFLGRDGAPVVAPRALSDGDYLMRPSLAYNGRHWAVAWSRLDLDTQHRRDAVYRVMWARFDTTGAMVGRAARIDSEAYGSRELHVAGVGDGFSVAWTLDSYTTPTALLQVRDVDRDGTAGELATFAGLPRNLHAAAIARDRRSFRVVLAASPEPAPLWFARANAARLDAPPRAVEGTAHEALGLSLASLGDESAVAWLRRVAGRRFSAELYLASVGPDGALRSRPARVQSPAPYAGSPPAFGWDGSTLLMAWFAVANDGPRRVVVTRVDPRTMAAGESLPVGEEER